MTAAGLCSSSKRLRTAAGPGDWQAFSANGPAQVGIMGGEVMADAGSHQMWQRRPEDAEAGTGGNDRRPQQVGYAALVSVKINWRGVVVHVSLCP